MSALRALEARIALAWLALHAGGLSGNVRQDHEQQLKFILYRQNVFQYSGKESMFVEGSLCVPLGTEIS